VGGFLAIFIWGTGIAVSRTLTDNFGVFSAGAFSFLLAGSLGILHSSLSKDSRVRPWHLPFPYLAICGSLFIFYQLCWYLALGLAPNHDWVVVAGIINYLWPVLTLVFSIPILKTRARWWAVPGFLLALSGTVLAMSKGAGPGPLPQDGGAAPVAVLILAFAAAIAWALYSNLARKHAGAQQGNAVPFFFLLSGLLMLLLRFVFHEQSQWTTGGVLCLAYMALFPCLTAYTLWDKAMRKGDIVLVTVFSYFTPLLSTVVTCVFLTVRPGWNLWCACLMLIAGALLSRSSLKIPDASGSQSK
jgi:drug/metabolite transporter (DMT)-like permease